MAIYSSLIGLSIKKLKSLLKVISASVPFVPDMKSSKGLGSIEKPEKIYLDNTHLLFTSKADIGTIRETFSMNQASKEYELIAPKQGDFLVDEQYLFEVGGKNKSFKQIKDVNNSFIASDDIEIGFGNKIPFWLFGFLY